MTHGRMVEMDGTMAELSRYHFFLTLNFIYYDNFMAAMGVVRYLCLSTIKYLSGILLQLTVNISSSV